MIDCRPKNMKEKEINQKLIIRFPTDDIKVIENFMNKMKDNDIVVVPEHLLMLIKCRDGYWERI